MADFFAAGLGSSPKSAYNPFEWSGLFAQAEEPDDPWTVPEAFFCILFTAVACDGDLGRLEQEELLALAHRSRALKALTITELGDVNASVAARMAARPEQALAEACAALPREMGASVLAHALDLVLCDGALAPAEAAFLNDLIAALGLDAETARRVADVMVLKNQY